MMNSQITKDQAQAVALAITTLRPDWHTAGIVKALSDSRDRGSAFDVAIAALNCAALTTNKTPAVIPMAGAHWVKGKPLGEGGPIKFSRCKQPGHGSFPAHNCGACRFADVEEITDPPHQRDRVGISHERVAEILAGAA